MLLFSLTVFIIYTNFYFFLDYFLLFLLGGDYMFSGHTVALTLLNFFITECESMHHHLIAGHTFIPTKKLYFYIFDDL